MNRLIRLFCFSALSALFWLGGPAHAAPCLEVVLTGVQGGPPVFNGQAGAGTLVHYGTEENKCSDVLLQFYTGRGTTGLFESRSCKQDSIQLNGLPASAESFRLRIPVDRADGSHATALLRRAY